MLREKLEAAPLLPFPPPAFRGAGVYALYYNGPFTLYAPLVAAGATVPVYVGKAAAGNSSYGDPTDQDGYNLLERIQDHTRSVGEASNVDVADFRVRYLVLDDAWVVLAERALLRAYRPVLWNAVMTGFGSNAPGGARGNGRSVWDTIHPGRVRAANLPAGRMPLTDAQALVAQAITASLMPDGPARDAAVAAVREA
ncbi:Eco29kI family restriction endonuclease [Actinotalea sp. JY-7876]|uniref:Eco29kI family restriction endonuclease n=1 Tax=Actinotalea sp. JY-7876 TaxID=2758442 RepID=UPI0015F4D219|nr:Eco29kI family restriction endonuclease [Actinotalea sp. JY-7876]